MHTFLWSTAAYLVAIGVLVTFHEFGHFWVARRLGVKVLRFSIGFGRPLWKRVARDGVEYVIAAIPLGGYVKMLDEREGEVAEVERHLAFNRQSVGRRAAIVFAGPLFNFILAVVAYWGVWVIGMPDLKPVVAVPAPQTVAAKAGIVGHDTVTAIDGKPVQTWSTLRTALLSRALDRESMTLAVRDPDGTTRTVTLDLASVPVDPQAFFENVGLAPYQPPITPVLSQVMAGGPADKAGFKVGDRIVAYDDTAVSTWQQWVREVQAHPGAVLRVKVDRDGGIRTLTLIVGRLGEGAKSIGHFGGGVEVPKGLWHDLEIDQRLNVVAALPAALRETWQMSALTLQLGYRVLTGDIGLSNIGGPIRTAEAAGYSAQMGIVAFISFLAFVSVNLGIVNLLPVPVLDGGHLLYCAVEAVRGVPLSERVQALGQQIGLTLLALLIGIVFYNDIASLMS